MPGMKLPRFSLRTLFLVVTVAAVLSAWFVYHWRWMQQREEARTWITVHHGYLSIRDSLFVDGGVVGLTRADIDRLKSNRQAPWGLRLLGEKSVSYVALPSPFVN